jgi:ElaB/YqjD/DUF883 family membrane-anchored ribosome-binding protein
MTQLPNTSLNTPTSTSPLPLTDAKDTMGHRLDVLTQQGSDAAHRLTSDAEHWARRNADQLRHQGDLLRERSQLQIREHPLSSVAIAAGTGVLVALLARWLLRR